MRCLVDDVEKHFLDNSGTPSVDAEDLQLLDDIGHDVQSIIVIKLGDYLQRGSRSRQQRWRTPESCLVPAVSGVDNAGDSLSVERRVGIAHDGRKVNVRDSVYKSEDRNMTVRAFVCMLVSSENAA
ncbi:hypothetical protein NX059_008191 [Plenodomus lindquistii]|nr:hypothetical protein NX059_008191 [Plenodomus lindquistii]